MLQVDSFLPKVLGAAHAPKGSGNLLLGTPTARQPQGSGARHHRPVPHQRPFHRRAATHRLSVRDCFPPRVVPRAARTRHHRTRHAQHVGGLHIVQHAFHNRGHNTVAQVESRLGHEAERDAVQGRLKAVAGRASIQITAPSRLVGSPPAGPAKRCGGHLQFRVARKVPHANNGLIVALLGGVSAGQRA